VVSAVAYLYLIETYPPDANGAAGAALAGLRNSIVDWATFDADFLNSVWAAAVPAFIGAAAVTRLVGARVAERVWTSWLLIAPIGGLIVLGYSLQYVVR
jgi:hypothetical protein